MSGNETRPDGPGRRSTGPGNQARLAANNGANLARWCNKSYDELMLKAKVATTVAERTKLYEDAQVIAKEEAPWIPIAHSVVFAPVRKEVVGYNVDPFGVQYFQKVDLK
ncbi:MAG: hypothetical protein EXQ90_03770 [Rhodospirillales bacterium]|nr:hypothetical protein [Rhodospirillales bacterium]